MPDHLHAILTLPPDDADFSGRWRRIKSLFTTSIRSSMVWSRALSSSGPVRRFTATCGRDCCRRRHRKRRRRVRRAARLNPDFAALLPGYVITCDHASLQRGCNRGKLEPARRLHVVAKARPPAGTRGLRHGQGSAG
jgi:hypothetical protein